MKKVVLAFAALAMLALGTSCSKEKTCHCEYTAEVLGVSTTVSLGDVTIDSGSCSDLENNGQWNAQIGNIVGAKIHCSRK
ncbi:MAG: hypothetical protein IKU00_07315 [Bacteroidales bacterium]|nr:hypothetical protein [Bacteroidales bacterium]